MACQFILSKGWFFSNSTAVIEALLEGCHTTGDRIMSYSLFINANSSHSTSYDGTNS